MIFLFRNPDSRGTREDARACFETVLDMQECMPILQCHWQEQRLAHPFVIRIALIPTIATRVFGSDQRLSYTIIGGELNVVQRLEANYDPGGILINHETYSQVDDLIDVEEHQSISLNDIERHTRTYAINGRKAEADKPLRLSQLQAISQRLEDH